MKSVYKKLTDFFWSFILYLLDKNLFTNVVLALVFGFLLPIICFSGCRGLVCLFCLYFHFPGLTFWGLFYKTIPDFHMFFPDISVDITPFYIFFTLVFYFTNTIAFFVIFLCLKYLFKGIFYLLNKIISRLSFLRK